MLMNVKLITITVHKSAQIFQIRTILIKKEHSPVHANLILKLLMKILVSVKLFVEKQNYSLLIKMK